MGLAKALAGHSEQPSGVAPCCLAQELVGGGLSLVAASLFELLKQPLLLVAADKQSAAYLFNDLQHLVGSKYVHFYNDSFRKPGAFDKRAISQLPLRWETLSRLVYATQPQLIVTYAEALMERVPPADQIQSCSTTLMLHDHLSDDRLFELMQQLGFQQVDFVCEAGQFAVRGCIVDVFSYSHHLPYRLERDGSELISIRTFDPYSQVSQSHVQRLVLLPDFTRSPASVSCVSLLDLFPPQAVCWLTEPDVILGRIEKLYADLCCAPNATTGIETEDASSVIPIDRFEDKTAILKALRRRPLLISKRSAALAHGSTITFQQRPQPIIRKNFSLLRQVWEQLYDANYELYLFSDQVPQLRRLQAIFDDLGCGVPYHSIPWAISNGFVDPWSKVACFTDHQIFDRVHRYRLPEGFSHSRMQALRLLRTLQPGDYVTHIDHGVGIFSGLEKMVVNGVAREVVRLVYRDNDLLYVDIQSLHKITKYVGKDGTPPRVNKLGTDAWDQLKRKIKDRIKDISKELIALYARRKATPGHAFSPDNYLQAELEASFLYEETPDQLKAIQDVKRDMERPHPMDRLVCGDVGFGKTEVAIRAAFKAAADGYQVAVLVPTTVLALQHYHTFTERLRDMPCTVDYLHRFKSAKEQKKTLEKLEQGAVDIIIGTSALLSKRVRFKNLGLLIIDEEQKFGVGAKEQLRKMRAHIDTLTLTATPIPRTLQFSLMGARDLSIINTPPPNRQPIETEHMVADPERIRAAIEFEMARGGQVFYVHNRVSDIEAVANMLRQLCPDYTISVAHGQMKDAELERRMIDFIEGKIDVLVCTNIVENGLDIPNANTIIINNAHQFGLSDLYQLRGRVGRSNIKAFCYLVTPPVSTLPGDALKRIRIIEEFSDLGSGFQISLRDLDIRGAGNILGAEQSGFIAEIGFDTYHKILDEAIRELRQSTDEALEPVTTVRSARECVIETEEEMRIPEEYVTHASERLSLYTELDSLPDESSLEMFAHRLRDRFGPLPQAVVNLLQAMRLRFQAQQLGLARIRLQGRVMKCYTAEDAETHYYDSKEFGRLMSYVVGHPHVCSVRQLPKSVLITFRPCDGLNRAIELLQAVNQYEHVL